MNSHHHSFVWIHTLHVNSYIVWIHTLLAQFLILECNYLSLSLEQRRWQKCYCSCQDNGNVRHRHPQNTNTRVWGLCLVCNHVVWHDGFRSSCCLSKSKNKSKSTKEIWNKNDSFFQMNFWGSTKRTGHYAWPCCSFSWSDCACDHPSCCRTCCSLHPCCCVDHNHGSIISMMIIRSAIIVIGSVALMVVAIFVATVLLVAWFTAMCNRNIIVVVSVASMRVTMYLTAILTVARFMAMHNRKMSHFLFLWLLLVLSNLLENASRLVGCLTLS